MSRQMERTFSVDTDSPVPDLVGVGPVVAAVDAPEVELVATYYDTADLRLGREGVTLRRRTGGHHAGWTLGLPLGSSPDDGREDVVAPLGLSRTPPPDLLDLVTAWVRSGAVAPVGELTTRRSCRVLQDADGRTVAELVDDRVTAQAAGGPRAPVVFRELRLTTAGGSGAASEVIEPLRVALLAAGAVEGPTQSRAVRALGAGVVAPPDPPASAQRVRRREPAGALVTAHLREQVRALLRQDVRVRRDAEDAVHRARVATRRLRSALHTFAPLLDPDAVAGLDDELRWLSRELGVARDSEVMLVRLRALVREQPEELVLGPVAARVDQRLLSDLLLARESALAALREQRYVALLERLVATAADPPLTARAERSVSEVMTGRVLAAWRRLERHLAPVASSADTSPERLTDADLHDARKAAKRARYAAEALAPTYGEDALAFGGVLAGLQALLGEHQDAVVARRVLRDLGVAAHRAGENAFTYGWLAAREETAAAAVRATLPAAWAEVSRLRHRRWLGD